MTLIDPIKIINLKKILFNKHLKRFHKPVDYYFDRNKMRNPGHECFVNITKAYCLGL